MALRDRIRKAQPARDALQARALKANGERLLTIIAKSDDGGLLVHQAIERVEASR